MGESELERRRAVLLGRPDLRVRTPTRTNFIFQLVHTSRPGTLDTSLVSTDNINNPRTMNAVYNLGPRLEHRAGAGARRRSTGGELNNKQFNDFVAERSADAVLPDAEHGLDAARAQGRLRFGRRARRAQPRLPEHRPVQRGMAAALQPAGRRQADHADRDRRRAAATRPTGRPPKRRRRDMALFFLKATSPHQLKDAPGGDEVSDHRPAGARPRQDASSPRPARAAIRARRRRRPPASIRTAAPGRTIWPAGTATGPGPRPTSSSSRCARSSAPPDFLDDNYLSTELRVPVTLLQTNACSPLATNAIAGNIWDNFSSQSYKDLPSVGTITVHDPFTGEPRPYEMPARRARLHAAAVADQPLVDGAVPAQQQRRAVRAGPVGRGAHARRSTRRSSRCCGRRSASATRCSATRCRA